MHDGIFTREGIDPAVFHAASQHEAGRCDYVKACWHARSSHPTVKTGRCLTNRMSEPGMHVPQASKMFSPGVFNATTGVAYVVFVMGIPVLATV